MSSAYVPKKLRELVAEQARYRCGYCPSAEGNEMRAERSCW